MASIALPEPIAGLHAGCTADSVAPVVLIMSVALATSSVVPWATSRNLSALSAVSYLTTLSLGMPIITIPATKGTEATNDDGTFQRRQWLCRARTEIRSHSRQRKGTI